MFLRLNRQRRGPCHPVAKRYIIFPLCAGSLKASSLPFVVLASKSAVVHSQNGPRDPVLERYEIHRATPESPRSQKMCIALVLRTVVSNKYGELPILIPLLAFFFFFFRPSALAFWWRDFGTSTLTHGSIASTASLFPEKNGFLFKPQAVMQTLGQKTANQPLLAAVHHGCAK